jgi:TrkA-N domain.
MSEVIISATVSAALGAAFISNIYSESSGKIYYLLEDTLKDDLETTADMAEHTIIVGYGVIGKEAADSLNDVMILDNDRTKIEAASEDYEALLGDARDSRAWNRCNVAEADRIVSTVRSDEVAERVAAMDVRADKYSLTESERDSSMLDLEIGVTQEELSKSKIDNQLTSGLENGFDSLREKLRKKLSSLS